MSVFGNKVKFTSPVTGAQKQSQSFTSFDETSIKINVVGGQSQLCPIKLNCLWAFPNITSRPPELSCKWFNKTEKAMSIIENVNGSYYQPCIQDVGTIVHVQCMPQIQDVQYQGMPIIKQVGPIKIDPQTQQQANDLLEAGKATFSIKIKQSENDNSYHQGLVKIQKNRIRLISKLTSPQKQLLNTQIISNNIEYKCKRNKGKQTQMLVANKQGNKDHYLFEVSSNKIRDVMILLVKLISAKQALLQETKISQQNNQQLEENNQLKSVVQNSQINVQNSLNKQELEFNGINSLKKQQILHQPQAQKKQQEKQAISKNVKKNSEQNRSTQQNKSNYQNKSSKKSQKSQQQTNNQEHNQKKNEVIKKVVQIKSSEQLCSAASPTIKKDNLKNQKSNLVTPVNNKHNALQILQITDLKKQIRAKQGQIFNLKKTIAQRDEQIENLKQQLNRMKQRQANLNCNYFQLEDQIRKIKQNTEKSIQQVSYYKNQNRILKIDLQNSQKKNKSLGQQLHEMQQKLSPFLSETNKQEQVQSYSELKQKYNKQIQIREQLQAKYQYTKEQMQKMQEKFIDLNIQYQQVQNEKNFYKKKYDHLALELQSQHGSNTNTHVHQSITSSPISQVKLLKQKSISMNSQHSPQSNPSPGTKVEQPSSFEQYNKLQKQILELKKQLKQSIQENNFLRSINAVSTKDKKSSSSKQTLKLQLAQMKKIVNRLTEALTQKDMTIDNMKIVNKQVSQKLIESQKKLDQFQRLASIQQVIKHHNSYT